MPHNPEQKNFCARSPIVHRTPPTSAFPATLRTARRVRRVTITTSAFVVLDQFRVIVGAEQRIQFFRVVRLHHEQPAVAVRILIDGFRLVGQRLVDRHHFTADRRVDIRRGFHRFHHRAAVAGLHPVADVWQLDVHEIAEQTLGMVGNADAYLARIFDARPLVRLLEFEITWNLAHGSCPRVVVKPVILAPRSKRLLWKVRLRSSWPWTGFRPSRCRRMPHLLRCDPPRRSGDHAYIQLLPSRTNGYFTARKGSSRPRMSTRRFSRAPAGTRANPIALPSVGEKMPDRISPSPLPVTTRWPWRNTPLSSITTPTNSRGTPSAFCFSSAARPMKSRPSSSDTVQARPASHGVMFSSMSWPYRFIPASRRNVSRAPNPAGCELGNAHRHHLPVASSSPAAASAEGYPPF